MKVNADCREFNSMSGLTGLALTTIGKSTKKSSWVYGDVAANSRKVCDFVCISAKNLVTVRNVDTESAN